MCGLPGYGPGDLIDMALDGDRVTITYDAGIDRPLRLTPDEALALVVALRMLAETPGTGTRDAIERALAKIENAAGDLADAPVAVRLPADDERLDAIRAAVERRHALRLTYYTATRDETTERVVDPMRVLMVGGKGIPGGVVPARRGAPGCSGSTGSTRSPSWTSRPRRRRRRCRTTSATASSTPPPDLPLVTLRVGRSSRWITEYYPVRGGPHGTATSGW